MKKAVLLSLFLLISWNGFSQDVPKISFGELFSEDQAWVLNNMDIFPSQVNFEWNEEEVYNMAFYIDEYHGRDSVSRMFSQRFPTRREFPGYDVPPRVADRLLMMFNMPTDSTGVINVSIPGFLGYGTPPIKLEPQGTLYLYRATPFALKEFQLNTRIPVMLYGSGWYDEQYDIYRYCMERQLPPDMDSPSFDHMPHYYIVSVEFSELQE